MASESVTGNAFEIAAWYDNNVVVQALIAAAYERGVAAGRTQAAADIRAEAERLNGRGWHADAKRYAEAAHIADKYADGSTDDA